MLECIRRSLSFLNSCYVDPIGSSGGLALWWMDRPSGVSVQKVHEVIDSSRLIWDESKLRSLVSGADCEAILSILVSVTDKDDTLLWHHDSKGRYTVKSGYHEAVNQAQLASSVPSSSNSWSDKEWLCDDRDSFSARDWFGKCFESLGTSDWGKSVLCAMVWVAWTIWKVPTSSRSEPTEVARRGPSWTPPMHGHWKLNCDAAVDLKLGKGSVAVLVRDHMGQLVDGLVSKIRLRSVAQGELLAIRYACLMAAAFDLTDVQIESDSQSVIHLCVSEGVPPWELLALLCDVRALASSRHLGFSWCPRRANCATGWRLLLFVIPYPQIGLPNHLWGLLGVCFLILVN
ncbi:hypothetical protein LOK49_LG01G00240 [Camellia lanceoleosa]|uniref:Uncharacterized protein n=1 Tax=Camellia lanceoleosa TaxID=1840588 RepID=A0ACC0J130_9ERIC|nr:hypothetical protein LOK49_LG01G00240 [Camellia lanceoleosa]